MVTADQNQLSSCDRLILPGVGAFEPAVNILLDLKFDSFIKDWANDGKPILGICLGMQLLFTRGEEYGIHDGLGLIKGVVKKIQLNLYRWCETWLFHLFLTILDI